MMLLMRLVSQACREAPQVQRNMRAIGSTSGTGYLSIPQHRAEVEQIFSPPTPPWCIYIFLRSLSVVFRVIAWVSRSWAAAFHPERHEGSLTQNRHPPGGKRTDEVMLLMRLVSQACPVTAYAHGALAQHRIEIGLDTRLPSRDARFAKHPSLQAARQLDVPPGSG